VLLNPNTNPSQNPDQVCCDSDFTMGGTAPQLPNGLRLLKPPYGRITAYDMTKGAIAWQIPNGDTPPNIKANLEKAGLTNVPPTGSPSQAQLLVTKNFLFAGEGNGGMAVFHAFDKKTGEEIWKSPMPAGPTTGVPMAYMLNGKQYIVSAARGPQGGGAQLIAWTVGPAPAAAPAGGRGGRGRGNQ
jgi:quinoprotein glucose dehydrogenase